jgi:hypothetical protein
MPHWFPGENAGTTMLTKRHLALGLATLAMIGLSSWGRAQTPTQGKQTESETKVIRSKLEKHVLATAHDYKNVYDLPFRTLATIGHRIELARVAPDPIALAEIAGEMKIAEEVSGKKSPLTSEQLMAEAVHLVQMRHVPEELKALSLMVEDEQTKAALKKQSEAADKFERERSARLAAGERGKGLNGTLIVVNHTDDVLYIYVDGVCVGQVQPFGTGQYFVNDNPYLARTFCQAIVNGEGQKASIQLERPYTSSYQWEITET